ncbi:hypothetical protein H8S37_03935 [Mediterraneibacter sp. NSJ-55]|uniref:RNA polymerase alpha subunit C-terminal domain-containing protein n=1 Tax=Mediterraneibacter hominis TaxID=2763054 RepID=A0A923RPY1_9FIRM|nr:DNA-directed RNA polymerase subunit alpha C-terminal domain-containing protein [Mediterraneibacter hominis]MBC5688083.1 hypothetical protein [Mediterraneibacter hominis]
MPKIETINMSIPAYMALKGHDINDINELSLCKSDEMLKWNIEKRTSKEIIEIMKEYGVVFREEETT